MIRIAFISFCLVLGIAGVAFAQGINRYATQSAANPAEIREELGQFFPPEAVRPLGVGFTASYAGLGMPRGLDAWLAGTFEAYASQTVADNAPVSLNISVVPGAVGSDLTLVMLGNKDEQKVSTLPAGSELLFGNPDARACRGQAALSINGPQDTASVAFADWAEGYGFALTDASDGQGTFFIGQRATCAMYLNIEPDPEEPESVLIYVIFQEG